MTKQSLHQSRFSLMESPDGDIGLGSNTDFAVILLDK